MRLGGSAPLSVCLYGVGGVADYMDVVYGRIKLVDFVIFERVQLVHVLIGWAEQLDNR